VTNKSDNQANDRAISEDDRLNAEHRKKMIGELVGCVLDFDDKEKNNILENILVNGFQGYQTFSDEDLMQELTDRDISYVFGENDDGSSNDDNGSSSENHLPRARP
jgi:hypothetical protein